MATTLRFTRDCINALRKIKVENKRRRPDTLFKAINKIVVDPLSVDSFTSFHNPEGGTARVFYIREIPNFMIFYCIGQDSIIEFTDVIKLSN